MLLLFLSDLFRIPFHGYDIYWFLAALFFIKIIHIFTERFISCWKFRALFWAVLFAVHELLPGTPSFCDYGLYFFIGYTLRQKKLITNENHPGIFLGITLFFAGIIFFSASYFYEAENIFTKTGAAMCSSLGLFVIFYVLTIRGAFLAPCGANSMVIYAIHGFVISSTRLIFRCIGFSGTVNPAVLFVITFFAAVLVPLCVIRLYRNVKCLRWIEYIFYPGKMLKK